MDTLLKDIRRKNIEEHVRKIGEDLRRKGIIGAKKSVAEKHVLEKVIWHKHCVECGKENPPGMARVCSSDCYKKNPLVDNFVDHKT